MPDYLDLKLPAAADPDALRRRGIAALQDGAPNFTAAQANPITRLLDFTGELAAQGEDLTPLAGAAIFRAFLRGWIGLEQLGATTATARVSIGLRAGHPAFTINAGTELAIGDVAFQTVYDAPVAPGADRVYDVLVVCMLQGARGNVQGPTTARLLDVGQIGAWVTDLQVTEAAHGGAEAESDAAYQDKGARALQTIGRPTLDRDFALLAINSHPDVGKAAPLRGYRPDGTPDGPTAFGVENCVTVAIATEEGEELDADVYLTVADAIHAQREQGWKTYVVPFTYTVATIAADLSLYPGFDQADVRVRAQTAVDAVLYPGTWGTVPVPPDQEQGESIVEPVLLRDELRAALNAVAGVNHVRRLTINGLDEDLPLAGVAGLTRSGGPHQFAFVA